MVNPGRKATIRMHELRRLRIEHAWSQAALAQAAGVSEFTILRLEQGKGVRPSTIGKVAAALGIPPKALIHEHAAGEGAA